MKIKKKKNEMLWMVLLQKNKKILISRCINFIKKEKIGSGTHKRRYFSPAGQVCNYSSTFMAYNSPHRPRQE